MLLTADQKHQRHALFSTILQFPQDSTARLVFADHLDETIGQNMRSEFIRVQVKLAEWRQPKEEDPYYDCRSKLENPGNMNDCYCPRTKEGELILCEFHQTREYEKKLLERWKEIVGPTMANLVPQNGMEILDRPAWPWEERSKLNNRFVFKLGMVSEFHCFPETWYIKGPTLVKQHPIVKLKLYEPAARDYQRGYSYNFAQQITQIYQIQCGLKCDQNTAALFWARRSAGMWKVCELCKGSGKIYAEIVEGSDLKKINCEQCEGRGWTSDVYES
jgi:uncharacterized protein (TIGR02996 family)